jgi:outer membrane lipoprotein SlyB
MTMKSGTVYIANTARHSTSAASHISARCQPRRVRLTLRPVGPVEALAGAVAGDVPGDAPGDGVDMAGFGQAVGFPLRLRGALRAGWGLP